jgi:hypothetical protein
MSNVDYAGAEWRPSPNFWQGGDGNHYVVIHATASNGVEYVPNFDAASGKSVHYAIAKDGHVVQYVREADSAWGNCCTDCNSVFLPTSQYNYNRNTISIEHEKYSKDNSEPPTVAQYAASLALVRDICKRNNIPMVHGSLHQDGVIFHHDLMPCDKALCPGNWPYSTYFQDLQGGAHMPLITTNGQVVILPKGYQLVPGQSGDKCGPWTVSELKYGVIPGMTPTANEATLNNWAHAEYERYIGPDVSSDSGGSSIDNMHSFFKDAGNLHYWDVGAISPTSQRADDIKRIHTILGAGFPMAVTVNEQSVKSKALGKCPYPWQPGLGPVNHIFAIVGIDRDGDFICADELNNQEAWPATYYAQDLEIHWASTVQLVGPDPVHPWLKPIPSGEPMDAVWAGFNAQNFGVQAASPGWISPEQEQQANDMWAQTALLPQFKGQQADATTDLAKSWRAEYGAGRLWGLPLVPEYHSVDWKGSPIVVLLCAWGRGEFNIANVATTWYAK